MLTRILSTRKSPGRRAQSSPLLKKPTFDPSHKYTIFTFSVSLKLAISSENDDHHPSLKKTFRLMLGTVFFLISAWKTVPELIRRIRTKRLISLPREGNYLPWRWKIWILHPFFRREKGPIPCTLRAENIFPDLGQVKLFPPAKWIFPKNTNGMSLIISVSLFINWLVLEIASIFRRW